MGRVPHGRGAPRNLGPASGAAVCWGMGQRLSMATRHEITKKYAREYERASKKDKGHQAQGFGPGDPAQATGAHAWDLTRSRS